MSRRTDKKKLKRMNESAVSQASVTVATVSTVKADDVAPAAETTAPVSQPSAAYDLYIQYQGADYNAEELASQILEKCKAEGMDSADLKIYVKPEDKKAYLLFQEAFLRHSYPESFGNPYPKSPKMQSGSAYLL